MKKPREDVLKEINRMITEKGKSGQGGSYGLTQNEMPIQMREQNEKSEWLYF